LAHSIIDGAFNLTFGLLNIVDVYVLGKLQHTHTQQPMAQLVVIKSEGNANTHCLDTVNAQALTNKSGQIGRL
jgi:hypothetical protein